MTAKTETGVCQALLTVVGVFLPSSSVSLLVVAHRADHNTILNSNGKLFDLQQAVLFDGDVFHRTTF